MQIKHKSLTAALAKAGYSVDPSFNGFRVVNGDNVLSWHKQDDYAICVRSGTLSNPTDSSTDYFPGHYFSTMKNAIAALGAK